MLQHLQQLDYEWNDNMKKTLTAIPLALLAATLFTACGDNGRDGSDSGSYYENHDYGYGNSDVNNRDNKDNNRDDRNNMNDRNDHDNSNVSDDFSNVGDDVKDTVDDVVDGVGDAGKGIINGAESAVDDITGNDRNNRDTTNPTAE